MEGDQDDAGGPPAETAMKPEPSCRSNDSGEEMITMMTFWFSILGDATAAVQGKGGGTLSLLQRRTGYTAMTIGGGPTDAKRMVTVTATNAIIGKKHAADSRSPGLCGEDLSVGSAQRDVAPDVRRRIRGNHASGSSGGSGGEENPVPC